MQVPRLLIHEITIRHLLGLTTAAAAKAFAPTLISTSGGLLGGILGNKNNQNMMREQMGWQTREREAMQAYQTSERNQQNAFTESMYNKYQSPQALVDQYTKAGLNPRLAVEGGAGSISASSGSSGGAPGAPSTSVPYQPANFMTSGFADIAKAVQSIAEAKKAGADTTNIENKLDAEKRKADAEALTAEITSQYAGKLKEEELANLKSIITNRDQQTENLNKELEILVEKHRITKFEADNIRTEYDTIWGLRKAQTENVNAETSFKKAQTVLIRLMQQTEKEKPALYRALAKVNNSIAYLNSFEYDVKNSGKGEAIEAYIVQQEYVAENVPKQLQMLQEQIELARKKNDWFMVDQLTNIANSLLQGAAAVYGARARGAQGSSNFQPYDYSVSPM